jgi:hypothetical protein
MRNSDDGSTNLVVGNIDDDASLEVVWGAGANSSGSDHLIIADFALKKTEHASIDFQDDYPPYILIEQSRTTICQNDSVQLTVNKYPYQQVEWSTGVIQDALSAKQAGHLYGTVCNR